MSPAVKEELVKLLRSSIRLRSNEVKLNNFKEGDRVPLGQMTYVLSQPLAKALNEAICSR